MRRWAVLLAAVVLCSSAVTAAALGGRTAAPARAVLKVTVNKELKKAILTDGHGRTLYMFTYDDAGVPTCEQADPACPKAWPAFTSSSKPMLGAGLNPHLVAIVKGAHGIPQVSYNKHPLYYYSLDYKIGDAKGQGSLGAWWVLSPKGVPIRQ
jgi:predicted lipoprotein with Yx(FWY)xxD motif